MEILMKWSTILLFCLVIFLPFHLTAESQKLSIFERVFPAQDEVRPPYQPYLYATYLDPLQPLRAQAIQRDLEQLWRDQSHQLSEPQKILLHRCFGRISLNSSLTNKQLGQLSIVYLLPNYYAVEGFTNDALIIVDIIEQEILTILHEQETCYGYDSCTSRAQFTCL